MIHSLKPGDILYPVRYTEPSFTNITLEFEAPVTVESVDETPHNGSYRIGLLRDDPAYSIRHDAAHIESCHVYPHRLYDACTDTAYYPMGSDYKNLLRNQIAEAEELKYAAIKRHTELSALYFTYFSK